MKISIRKYLLYSSVFAIFTEAFFFHLIIDWKLLYLIILVNYFLLLRIKKLKFNIYFLLLLLGFLVHALTANTLIDIPYRYAIAQLIGISILGIYYYNFIPLYPLSQIKSVYSKMCLYVAILGYPLYFLNINVNDGRLQSIFTEPAHYAIVVIPACYYFFKEKKYWSFAAIFGTLILSNSSLGYIGCGLMFIVPNISLKRISYLVCLLPVIIGIFIYIYQEYPFFKLRVEETYESLNVINTGKFDNKTNLSSYALISNLYVAKNNIQDHPLGTGIGSHIHMHKEVYLKQMRPPQYIRTQNKHTINAPDANSLFTRIVSEMGIFGFLLIFVLLYLAFNVFQYKDMALAQGLFIYILLKLFRDGHYFPPEFFFFIWLLYYSLKEKTALNNNKPLP
ncbi:MULTISPECIES: O-antigen ligase family protein [unclassified Flavobacterium]|uniref:O-antigen ligase family protein n=1 Tax=unclassified Flavobacterium TaxID=196869 RepID=UPI00260501E4|nr:O-antigen ligase family protein [Flavobacterium sp.]